MATDKTLDPPLTREVVRDGDGRILGIRDIKPDAQYLSQQELDELVAQYVTVTATATAKTYFLAGMRHASQQADEHWRQQLERVLQEQAEQFEQMIAEALTLVTDQAFRAGYQVAHKRHLDEVSAWLADHKLDRER